MHYQYYGKHLAVKITKWHTCNSCNTDPSALIFLQTWGGGGYENSLQYEPNPQKTSLLNFHKRSDKNLACAARETSWKLRKRKDTFYVVKNRGDD